MKRPFCCLKQAAKKIHIHILWIFNYFGPGTVKPNCGIQVLDSITLKLQKIRRKNCWRHISDETFNRSRRVTFQLGEQKWPFYQSQLGSGPAALKRVLQLFSSRQVGILSKDMKSWRRYSLRLSPRSNRRSRSVGERQKKKRWNDE